MSSQPPTVFISYSRKDEEYKRRLLTHLQGLVKRGVIAAWHDGLLVPGCHWDKEIRDNLEASRIILLLVSPDFVASEYAGNVELAGAAERHARGEAVVIPVLIKRVHNWQELPFGGTTLGALQALPGDLKFIAGRKDKDAAFANVVAGIEEAAAALPKEEKEEPAAPQTPDPWRVRIPAEPSWGVAPRIDQEGRDIVSQLVERLAPGQNGYVLLSGSGGVGKTTLAAEAARQLEKLYDGRVVWSDAAGREQYTLLSLFDDVALKLGGAAACPRPSSASREAAEEKAEEVVAGLLKSGPALVVIDSYEAAEPAERRHIERWFQKKPLCPALFVSQARITHLDVHNIFVLLMRRAEEVDLLGRLLRSVKFRNLFTHEICACIYDAADGNPLAMKLIVPQIDLATGTEVVFEELKRGVGETADHAFNRAFERHLEADDRAVLLALSLFTPSASHRALARVAGFVPAPKPGEKPGGRPPSDPATKRGMKRLYKALSNLNLFSLLKVESRKPGGEDEGVPCEEQGPQGEEPDCRLALETLTRRLARATLDRQPQAAGFKSRFIDYFRWHARKFDWDGCKDLGAAETERSNVVAAMKFASERKDWDTVLELYAETLSYVNTFVVWKRSVLQAENEAEHSLLRKGWRAPLLIEINHRHEHREEARKHYKSIPAKLGMPGVASHTDLIGYELPPEGPPHEEKVKLVVLSVVSFELGVCAYYRAGYRRGEGAGEAAKRLGQQARDYFEAAKVFKRGFGDEGGYAIACNNLGVTLAVEGLAGDGGEDWRAQAAEEFEKARRIFEQQRKEYGKYEKFEKVVKHNIEWLEGLRG
jgi:hypothetical protein